MDYLLDSDDHPWLDYNRNNDLMQAALATEGLALAVLVAGIVRGFIGFGSAPIYLPIAGIFLPPTWVIATMISFRIFGPLPLLPHAWRAAIKPRFCG